MIINYGIEFDEKNVFELKCKGYYPGVTVINENGKTFPLVFYDPTRLAQDVEEENIICDKNLVVIPEVTKDWIDYAISRMISEDYFS